MNARPKHSGHGKRWLSFPFLYCFEFLRSISDTYEASRSRSRDDGSACAIKSVCAPGVTRPVLTQRSYSRGSSFTIDAPWLLPTQKVGGVVELSTKTRRTFVNRGRRYSTISPLFGLSRRMRSLYSPPDHASPFLSAVTS